MTYAGQSSKSSFTTRECNRDTPDGRRPSFFELPSKKLSRPCGLKPLTGLGGEALSTVLPVLPLVGGGLDTVLPPDALTTSAILGEKLPLKFVSPP